MYQDVRLPSILIGMTSNRAASKQASEQASELASQQASGASERERERERDARWKKRERRDLKVSVQEAQRRFCSCGPTPLSTTSKSGFVQHRTSQTRMPRCQFSESESWDLGRECLADCHTPPGYRPRNAKVTALHLVALCATPFPASTRVFGDEQRAANEPPPGSEASH